MHFTEYVKLATNEFHEDIAKAEADFIRSIKIALDSGSINFEGVRRLTGMGDRRLHRMAQRHLGQPLPTRRRVNRVNQPPS